MSRPAKPARQTRYARPADASDYLTRRTPGTARGFELALSMTWTETTSLLVVLSASIAARPQSTRLSFWVTSPAGGTRMFGQFNVWSTHVTSGLPLVR